MCVLAQLHSLRCAPALWHVEWLLRCLPCLLRCLPEASARAALDALLRKTGRTPDGRAGDERGGRRSTYYTYLSISPRQTFRASG